MIHFARQDDPPSRTLVQRLSRRACMAAIGSGVFATLAWAVPTDRERAALAALEHRSGGRLGVFITDLANGHTLAYRADERFRLESSFKALLTGMVLHQEAAGRVQLDELIRYIPADLVDASPVTTADLTSGSMTVDALCAATMAYSDNTASNLLLRRMGGPIALTAFLRSIQDITTQLDHYEPLPNTPPYPADSTTPRAIIATLGRLLSGPLLPDAGHRKWAAWMASNTVGRRRLRAAFPLDWEAGDRTGTAEGVCNDIAFARRPGRAPLLIAAFYDAPGTALGSQEAVLSDVGRVAVAWQAKRT